MEMEIRGHQRDQKNTKKNGAMIEQGREAAAEIRETFLSILFLIPISFIHLDYMLCFPNDCFHLCLIIPNRDCILFRRSCLQKNLF